MKKCKRNY